MSTADTTSLSSGAPCSAPASSRRKRSYTPGRRVENLSKRRCQGSQDGLPFDLLDHILQRMVDGRAALSIIKLSMVNRAFRQGVNANLKIWHQLYLHWRGPIQRDVTRQINTPRGIVRLRPTLPTTVPNFRHKTPPTT
jgi:hypothetical protein